MAINDPAASCHAGRAVGNDPLLHRPPAGGAAAARARELVEAALGRPQALGQGRELHGHHGASALGALPALPGLAAARRVSGYLEALNCFTTGKTRRL